MSGTRSRKEKVARIAHVLREMEPREIRIGVAYLAGDLPQGRIGIGWATVRGVNAPAADGSTLTLLEVDTTLQRIADTSGSGSQATREALLHDLLARATAEEQSFLRALLLRELRQGALESLVVDALAVAGDAPTADVRRAVMFAGDVRDVAATLLSDGPAALARYRLTLLRPVQPMLAQTAESVADAVARVGEAVVDHKLDGARLQIHRDGDEVAVFTRSLRDVTADVPAIVSVVRSFPASQTILDTEALGLDAEGGPLPFQETMRRFGSGEVRPYVFDILHLGGDDLIDLPLRERLAAIEEAIPLEHRIARRVVGSPDEAAAVFDDALAAGHEGVVVKDLDAPYEAGRRGASWLKVKPVHTLDLVVLAAEWGSGRRRGWLSNLHLGARDPSTGGFVMLGKTFKGMTDEVLEWQTEQLLAREVGREGHIVHVRPELVAEVAFDGVQTSSRYPGGVALRFARLKRYRDDKDPTDADTIDAVLAHRR